MKDIILVTGASGLVGMPLINKLLEDYEVIGLDLEGPKIFAPTYIHLRTKIKKISDFLTILEKYKVSRIVHSGGVSGPMLYNNEPHTIIENNVFLTMNLVEAMRQYKKIKKLVFCSSISAYGDINVSNTNEDLKLSPTNLYGSTKASCDLMLEIYKKDYNLDVISLRFSTIYGQGRLTSCFINDIIKSGLEKKNLHLPFKSDLQWPYIYVNDVVKCILKCLFFKEEHEYTFNVSGPDYPSYEQIVTLINSHFHNLNVTFSSINEVTERKNFSANKIKSEINWEPKFNIKEGLNDYLNKIKFSTF
ncbi:NAD(P)-dependent oxidoreductase [bacterium]|nr:NAD(P)-dependent oxidoreductase [bacterium]